MSLQLINPSDKYVMKHTVLPEAVMGHIADDPGLRRDGGPSPDGFDQREQLAIRTFGPAHGTEFSHPLAPAGRKLTFDNRRENSPPQNTLYLLVG